MSELQIKLEEIKRQKDTYIIPENIKKDITVYGVTGTYEGSGGSGDVKLFDTVEHMQQDPAAQEGDFACVYREEIQPVTEESEFDGCIFPNTVVLDEAFTGSIYGSFRSTGSGWFDGNVDMSSSNFRFNGFGDKNVRITYTSSDGITYTRTDGGEELQEFGTTIKYEPMEPWNDVIGNFMKIGGNYFDGMYEYGNYLDLNYHSSFININSIIKDGDYFVASIGKFIPDLYNIRDTRPYVVLQKSSNTIHNISFSEMIEAYELADSDNWIGPSRAYPSGVIVAKDLSENKFTMFYVKASTSDQVPDIQSIEIGHYINNNLVEETKNVTYYGKSTYVYGYKFYFYKIADITEVVYVDDIYFSYSYSGSLEFNVWQYYSTTDVINGPQYLGSLKFDSGINYNKYNLISSQLDATADYVYEKTFYGKNGVENGILTTNVSNSFADVNAEVYTKIQEQYDSMQPRIVANQERIDTSTKCIPCKSDGTPLLDTSNVTNMKEMFYGCKNLITIPLLDTSNVTNMSDMFVNCEKLSKLPLLDTSNVTNMNNMFYRCFALKTIPLLDTSNVINMGWTFMSCGIEELPSLDTSNVTDMSRTFDGCSHLVILPQLDTSSVTSMDNAFYGCTSLSNTSLNNILAMCANSAITSTKTLKYIGLTQEQANICTTLSNYSAFTTAGWTTGY